MIDTAINWIYFLCLVYLGILGFIPALILMFFLTMSGYFNKRTSGGSSASRAASASAT